MKIILLFFLIIGFYSFKYDTKKAVKYAQKHCINHNPVYYFDYEYGDAANFVSQCMIEGGMNFKGCTGVDDLRGVILNVGYLKVCLDRKGFKSSKNMVKKFKAGYPIAIGNSHIVIASKIEGSNVYYCAHSIDRCDALLNSTSNDLTYYYI